MQLIPGSPFFDLLKSQGLNSSPLQMPVVPKTPRKKAATKLKKWSCKCEPKINVRVAVPHFSAKCLHCGCVFELQDTPSNEEPSQTSVPNQEADHAKSDAQQVNDNGSVRPATCL